MGTHDFNSFFEFEQKRDYPENILLHLKKKLKEKKLDKHMIGEIALLAAKNFLGRTTVEGKLYYNILYIKILDQEQNIQLFLQKKDLLFVINEKIKKLGYNFMVKDIRGKYEL